MTLSRQLSFKTKLKDVTSITTAAVLSVTISPINFSYNIYILNILCVYIYSCSKASPVPLTVIMNIVRRCEILYLSSVCGNRFIPTLSKRNMAFISVNVLHKEVFCYCRRKVWQLTSFKINNPVLAGRTIDPSSSEGTTYFISATPHFSR